MGLFFTPFDQILSSATKLRLLRALHAARAPVSGREAASAAGVSLQPAQRALADLVAAGVVHRSDTRSQHLYAINRESFLVEHALHPLFRAEEERVEMVFRELRQMAGAEDSARPGVEGLFLFGSAARGEDRIGSDLDVLAVVEGPADVDGVHEKLAEGAEQVYTRHGLRLSVVVIPLQRLREMHSAGDALVQALLRDNRRITGTRLEQLIHGDAGKPKGSGSGAG